MSHFKDKEKSQRDRFVEAARKLDADESEVAVGANLATIAKQKPNDIQQLATLRETPTVKRK